MNTASSPPTLQEADLPIAKELLFRVAGFTVRWPTNDVWFANQHMPNLWRWLSQTERDTFTKEFIKAKLKR